MDLYSLSSINSDEHWMFNGESVVRQKKAVIKEEGTDRYAQLPTVLFQMADIIKDTPCETAAAAKELYKLKSRVTERSKAYVAHQPTNVRRERRIEAEIAKKAVSIAVSAKLAALFFGEKENRLPPGSKQEICDQLCIAMTDKDFIHFAKIEKAYLQPYLSAEEIADLYVRLAEKGYPGAQKRLLALFHAANPEVLIALDARHLQLTKLYQTRPMLPWEVAKELLSYHSLIQFLSNEPATRVKTVQAIHIKSTHLQRFENIAAEFAKKAKTLLTGLHPSESAAAKGEIFKGSMPVLKKALHAAESPKSAQLSEQDVVLVPGTVGEPGAVFKSGIERVETEESFIEGVSAFFMEDFAAPGAKMGRLSPERFGFSALTQSEQQRAFVFSPQSNTQMIEQLTSLLSKHNDPSFPALQTALADSENWKNRQLTEAEKSYEGWKDKEVALGEGAAKTVPFLDVAKAFKKGELHPDVLINNSSLQDHLDQSTPLGIALQYYATGAPDRSPTFGYFIPQIASADEEREYRSFETAIWEIRDPNTDKWKRLSFQELIRRNLGGNLDSHDDIRRVGQWISLSRPEIEQAKWEVQSHDGQWKKVNFQELAYLWLSKELNQQSRVRQAGQKAEKTLRSQQDLLAALNNCHFVQTTQVGRVLTNWTFIPAQLQETVPVKVKGYAQPLTAQNVHDWSQILTDKGVQFEAGWENNLKIARLWDQMKKAWEQVKDLEVTINTSPKPMPFHEFARLYAQDSNAATLLENQPVMTHIRDGTSFGLALRFAKEGGLKDPDRTLGYFVPQVAPADQAKFAAIATTRWGIQQPDGTWVAIKFSDLHLYYLSGLVSALSQIGQLIKAADGSEQLGPVTALSANADLMWAMGHKMKLIPSQIQRSFPKGFVAKSFIPNMILMGELGLPENRKLYRQVMGKLTAKSPLKALLTLDLQFFDLHSQNLGVSPVPNAEFRKLEHERFTYTAKDGTQQLNRTLPELQRDYLKGSIGDDTVINGIELRNYSDLKRALDCEWEFRLFDTDLCMGESNELIAYNASTSFLPLRSTLLGSPWKDRRLDSETLARLKAWDSSRSEALSRMKGEDTPLYRRLSADAKATLAQTWSKYTLENKFAANINELRRKFAEELATDFGSPLWQELQQKLGGKPSLTAPIPAAQERRKQIALQLAPRTTVKQQQAYVERVQRRTAYLDRYESLEKLVINAPLKSIRDSLEEHIREFGSVLSSFQRMEINAKLQKYSEQETPANNQRVLMDVLTRLKEWTQPTYYNIAKAEYPLMADLFMLFCMRTKAENPTQTDAWVEKYVGGRIGCTVDATVEKLVVWAKNKGGDAARVAQDLIAQFPQLKPPPPPLPSAPPPPRPPPKPIP